MARLYPDFQTFLDTRDGDVIGVTDATIVSTSSDHVPLPEFVDVRILTATNAETLPTFYASNGDKQVSIDGATVGTRYTIVTRHRGIVNNIEEGA